ncbi:hypothetical protein [Catenulispora subtropica]|uniref:VWFA domain-containing protein n=1 Tax=Catenulispora subtropica TaxID=450798 RepID=A0ABN2R016_9ACTN
MTADPSVFARHGYQERIPLVLVLDTSASMGRPAGRPRIDQLGAALAELLAGLHRNPAHAARVDVAMVRFSSRVEDLDGGFRPVGEVRVPPLAAGGHSVMLPAIRHALELGAAYRSGQLHRHVPCRPPVVCLITDGAPTDEDGAPQDHRGCAAAATALRAAAARGSRFVAVGVGGADMGLLATLAPAAHYEVDDFDIGRVVEIITASVETSGAGGDPDADYERIRRLQEIRRLEQGM